MATSSPVALFNTDPNVQAQAALLQRQQAMAQALMEQGMKPLDTGNRTVGGVGYNISPMEGLAKMLQAYSGRKGLEDTTQQQAGLASQAYAALLNKYQPGTDPSYSDAQRQGAESAGMPGPGTDGMGPPDPQKMAAALMTQQPAQGGQNPNNPNGIPAELIAGYTAGMVPKEVFEAQAARYKPTEATVQSLQAGADPRAANQVALLKANSDPKWFALHQAGFPDDQIHQMMAAEAQKGNTMEGRPGQSLYTFNGSGPPQLTAVAPDPNNNQQFTVGPGGAVSAKPVPGSVPAKSELAGGTSAAAERGKTEEGVYEVTLKDGRKIKVRGSEIPPLSTQTGDPEQPPAAGAITNPGNLRQPGQSTGFAQYPTPEAGLAAIDQNLRAYGAKGVNTVSAIISRWAPPSENNTAAYIKDVADRLGVKPNQPLDMNSPLVRHALSTGIMLHEQGPAKVFGAPPVQMGQSTAAAAAATASQDELSKAWSSQQGAHQNAQTNIALLQNMKGLTDKAITGYEPDRRTYLAKLGAYVGISSMDEKASASDLTNKYSAQLIAGLAQKGGMSTDAARDLVMAGTPNSHMQPGAIKEAIDGLVAREQMTQARTAALQKHANARDPVAFQQAATAFDQAADPRLFQLRNMAPAQAQSYVNQLKATNPAAYQQLMQKASALKQMGAF